jgi:quinol monooxygenase YgiN
MILIVGTVRLPPNKTHEAKLAMRAMILASRAESGCVEYSFSEDVLEPGLIHVTERWKSREALRTHAASDHMRAWRSAGAAFQISDRKIALYEVGEPESI